MIFGRSKWAPGTFWWHIFHDIFINQLLDDLLGWFVRYTMVVISANHKFTADSARFWAPFIDVGNQYHFCWNSCGTAFRKKLTRISRSPQRVQHYSQTSRAPAYHDLSPQSLPMGLSEALSWFPHDMTELNDCEICICQYVLRSCRALFGLLVHFPNCVVLYCDHQPQADSLMFLFNVTRIMMETPASHSESDSSMGRRGRTGGRTSEGRPRRAGRRTAWGANRQTDQWGNLRAPWTWTWPWQWSLGSQLQHLQVGGESNR